jgi:MFS family permease
LATLSLFLICFGLIEGQPHNWGKVWGPITIPEIIAAGVVVLAIFIWQQYMQREKEPLVPFSIFKDRNYSVMNFVVAAISFGMLGLFLPLVIYLQSVLGLTALQAGLTLAPMSLISMFVAPVAGRLSDKFGGKWILFTGLSLWTLGLSILLASSHPDSSRWHLLPGLLVAGFGLGMTFAPLQTIAMLNVPPRLAGAASGMITTTRQLGAVIGSAAVGALLQAQLSDQLTATATENAAALPEQFRSQFIDGFSNAATKGLEVGAGQTGVALPPGLPAQVVQTIMSVAAKTFHEAFTSAMRSTLILPLIVLGIAALAVILVRRKPIDATAKADHAELPAG